MMMKACRQLALSSTLQRRVKVSMQGEFRAEAAEILMEVQRRPVTCFLPGDDVVE